MGRRIEDGIRMFGRADEMMAGGTGLSGKSGTRAGTAGLVRDEGAAQSPRHEILFHIVGIRARAPVS